jgi:hypothetical protein
MIIDIDALKEYLSVLENRFNVSTKQNIDKAREHIAGIAHLMNCLDNYRLIGSNTSNTPTGYRCRIIDIVMKCPIYQHGDLMDKQLHSKKWNNTLLGEERVRQYNVRLCTTLSYIYYLFTKLNIRNDMAHHNILHFNTFRKIQRQLVPANLYLTVLFNCTFMANKAWEYLVIECIAPPVEIETIISSSDTLYNMKLRLKPHLHYYAIETPKLVKNEPDIFKIPDMYDEHDVIVV